MHSHIVQGATKKQRRKKDNPQASEALTGIASPIERSVPTGPENASAYKVSTENEEHGDGKMPNRHLTGEQVGELKMESHDGIGVGRCGTRVTVSGSNECLSQPCVDEDSARVAEKDDQGRQATNGVEGD
jgi:hypothetical protein